MQKQEEVFKKFTKDFLTRADIYGVLLMGSVAANCASENSDLDIMVLCNENKFEVKYIDNVMVEIIYTTYERRLEKLNESSMEVYHFLQSKIEYDNGYFAELIKIANNKYENYVPTADYIKTVTHWLESTRLKLSSAINQMNGMNRTFYASTNVWKVLEGIWMVNRKPMPPSASVLRFHKELSKKPCENWFEKLFTGNGVDAFFLLEIIDWILLEVSILY
ncbi:MAG: hypothetical protein K0S76_2431 [Herbinix sp.]|nr:hypothetical protein [Herbinix sp.]